MKSGLKFDPILFVSDNSFENNIPENDTSRRIKYTVTVLLNYC